VYVAVGVDKLRCGPLVEVRDDVYEVLRESEVYYCPNQLVVVGEWESSLEVQVTKGNVLVVGVCALYAEAEVRNGSRTLSVRQKALLFWAEDFPTLHMVGGQHDYACGP